MLFKPDHYRRLRELIRGRHLEAEVDEEFEHHLALRMDAYMAEGMSMEQARAAALRRFGNVAQFQRETTAIDHSTLREQKRMQIMDSMRRELKLAARGLWRAPGFTLVAVATLALGLGASTAVYTLVDAVVLNPLPYPTADRLARIDHEVPGVKAGSYWESASATYYHYTDQAQLFEAVGAYSVREVNVKGLNEAARVRGAQVTAPLFDVLGARPAVGRLIEDEDDRPQAPVVVLGYDYWQREFGGDPAIVGRTIEFEGATMEVLGVAERGFSLPDQRIDVYLPRGLQRTMQHRNWHHLSTIALLKPGVTPEIAQRELTARQPTLVEAYPSTYQTTFFTETGFRPRVQDLRAYVVGNMGRILWIVLGAVGVVLLIASANVANLFLVRAEIRRNEVAIRSALGAGRAHRAVQAVAESLLLTVVAGAIGVWLAAIGIKVLVAIAPSSLPRLSEIQLSTNAVLFALALAVTVGLVLSTFSLLRQNTSFAPLREGGRGLTSARAQLRTRAVLVTLQIALALVLLAASGLILRSFDRLRTVESGIDPENVLVVDVSIPFRSYSSYASATQFWRTLTDRISALPGVQRVGAVSDAPLSTDELHCATLMTRPFAAKGEVPGCLTYQTAMPGFFEALGIPVRGRTPTWQDIDAGTGAIVITKSLAERLWPGQDAIGKGIRGNGRGERYYEVVGVLGDIRAEGLNKPNTQIVYFPPVPMEGAPLWMVSTSLSVVIKAESGDPVQLAPAIRRVVSEVDRSAAIGSIRTMQQIVSVSMARLSFTMILLGIAGVMALVISIVGLYGVIAYLVSRRQAEIGIRMALGAPASEVRGMIVLQSVRLGAAGVALGLLGALFTMRMLQSLLFEVTPTDPVTLMAVSFLLLATSVVASLVPALRAARVSPLEALRN